MPDDIDAILGTGAPAAGGEMATKLPAADEQKYQAWRTRLPKELQYEGDYDLRGFYKKNPTFTATSGQHMTDEFKLPNHKTFSNESRYYNEQTKHLGGHWEGDVYIPNDTRYKQRVDESGGAGGDDIDAILGEAPPKVVGLDMGMAARRARAGLPPGPRDVPEADVQMQYPGMITTFGASSRPRSVPLLTPEDFAKSSTNNPFFSGVTYRPADPMEVDPIAQGVVANTVLGPLGRVLSAALPAAAAPVVAAGEGAAASKMMGGSALQGAALGGGVGMLGTLARTATPAAAAARAEARLAKDVTKGKGANATGRVANDVKYAAGADNATLAEVADELPAVGKALKTQAKTNPGAAHKVTAKTVDELTDANDAVYAAIQRQHGGVSLQPIAERLAGLEERMNQQGNGVAADAVARIRTDLLKRYAGDPNVGLADVKLSAQQIRNIRNNMQTTADPARNIKPNTRRDALSKVSRVLNKEIEDVAADTRGVNVNELRARNRQISTLIPVRDALAQRAEKLADREITIVGLAKEVPKKAAQRLGREFDYRLSQVPLRAEIAGPNLPGSVPATANAAREQSYAGRVASFMANGMTLPQAVTAAEGN